MVGPAARPTYAHTGCEQNTSAHQHHRQLGRHFTLEDASGQPRPDVSAWRVGEPRGREPAWRVPSFLSSRTRPGAIMLLQFIKRLRRKSPPDLRQFGLDAAEVMRTRISCAIAGDLSAAEARRMVLEKLSAGMRAQFACTQALLKGNPAAAGRACFDIYQRAVQSNRKRLGKRRWLSLPGRRISRPL
jgi:hypothetical protein